MSELAFDRFVSGTDWTFDRFVDIAGTPTITAVGTIQDGATFTITGTSFSASGNEVRIGPIGVDGEVSQIVPIGSEGTTSITTDTLDASSLYLTGVNYLVVKNSSGVPSNIIEVTISPKSGETAVAVTQEYLGSGTTRLDAIPSPQFGDEWRIGDVFGGTVSDITFRGQGDFDAAEAVTSFSVRLLSGGELGASATQTLEDPVTTATVPNISGLTQASATTAVQAVGLVLSVVDGIPSAITLGNIVTQFPAAGTSLTIGGVVEVVTSLGSDVVLVPNLSGLLLADAQSARSSAGLAGTDSQYIDGNNSGSVLNQSVAPGTLVSVGSSLNLVYSSNLAPDVVGQSLSVAQSILVGANLTVDADVAESYSDAVPGVVIGQLPIAGATVSASDPVTLTVSLGAVSSVNVTANASGYTVGVTSQADGTAYIVAVPRNSNPPTADQIAAGLDGSSQAALARISGAVSSGVEAQLPLSGVELPKTDIYSTVYDGVSFSNVDSALGQLKSAPSGRQYVEVA